MGGLHQWWYTIFFPYRRQQCRVYNGLVLYLFVCTYPKGIHITYSTVVFGRCSYHFSLYSRSFSLHYCQCMAWATLSCLHCLYCFCASFPHSETIWATVSSRSPQILQRGEISTLSIRCWIDLVLMACSWAAIRVPSVAFFKSPFFSQSQVLGSLNSVALKKTLWSYIWLAISSNCRDRYTVSQEGSVTSAWHGLVWRLLILSAIIYKAPWWFFIFFIRFNHCIKTI